MKAIHTGMVWVNTEDLSASQIIDLHNSYTYQHPREPDQKFCTLVQLKDRIGIPSGDINKIHGLLSLSEVVDRTISTPFDGDVQLTGLTLRDYQEKALEETLDYFKEGGRSFNLSGEPGCVDKDTEFLTPTGWKKISDYQRGDKVLQVSKDLKADFVPPDAYINEPTSEWYSFKFGGKELMKTSGEHRVIYETSKGNLAEALASDLFKNTPRLKLYSNVHINKSTTAVRYSDDEIRFIVAVAADGSQYGKQSFRVNIKREDKKHRFSKLIDSIGIKYSVSHKENGYDVYHFQHISEIKDLSQLWASNDAQLGIIYDEFAYWDGRIDKRTGKKQFFTTNKSDADFIQYVITTQSDCLASISSSNRTGQSYYTGGEHYTRKSIEYTVYETTIKNKTFVPKRLKTIPDTLDKISLTNTERKYCFTVPTGMFLARKNDFVFVTGNSGKSVMLSAIIVKLGVKTLVIAHLSMLVEQLRKEIEEFTNTKVTVLDKDNLELGDINIATSQFISQRPELWYKIKKTVGLIAVDEAETVASESTLRILQRAHARYRIAVTATFTRSVDGRTPALTDMIGHKVIALENDKLLKPTIITVRCDETFQAPANKNLYKRALSRFFDNHPSITDKVIAITESSLKKNRQVLIAADVTKLQERYASILEERGITCGIMNKDTKKVDRDRILREYDEGKIKVLLGFGVLNAGLSIPKISTIIRVATPGNVEKLEQLIGRARRDYRGKEGAWLIDLMFSGFVYANRNRMHFYNQMKRRKDWKVAATTWEKFSEKLGI